MRSLFFSFLFLLCTISGFSQGTAGLTIPANQTFVLGEYRTTNYRASVVNKGYQKVSAVLIDRETREEVQRVEIWGRSRESVQVPADQVLHLINPGDKAAELMVKSPVSGSEGMGFIDSAEASARTRKTKIDLPSPAAQPSASGEVDRKEVMITKATLEPGQHLIIGEGSAGDFNVFLSNNGSGLEVSGREKGSGRKTQGFGIGKFGQVDMYLRPDEVLYLVNNSTKRSTIKVKADRPIAGVRITNR